MDLGLTGRKAIVTGASKGIGRAIARQLLLEGANVAICARGEGALKETADELASVGGGQVHARAVDVADGAAYTGWIADAGRELGGLDIFVANASAGVGTGEQSWRNSFEIDVMGLVRGVEAALPMLAESDGASVVVISTAAALETFGLDPANSYAGLKAAIVQHASGLAQRLGPQGIRVNAVSPGPIYFEGGTWDMVKQHMTPFYEATLATVPLGRLGSPEEVAQAATFLASPAASFISGANLVVDGGATKRHQF